MNKIKFTRNSFGGPNADIERLLETTRGAIFLRKPRNGERFAPEDEGDRLFKVLNLLFPKATLDVLARKLSERG